MTTLIRIRALAHGGDGVGTPVDAEGPTWFVRGALPGEEVEAEAEHVAKRFTRGRTVRVVKASDKRVEPPCPLATTCGGCGWQHVHAAAQAEFKARIVADQLRAITGGNEVRVGFASDALGYRRRARLHYRNPPAGPDGTPGGLVLGYFGSRSRNVVDVDRCPVLEPVLDRAFSRLREVADVLGEHGEVVGLSDGQRVLLGLPSLRPEPARLERLRTLLDDTLVGIALRGSRQRGGVGLPWLEVDAGPGLLPVRLTPFAFAQAQSAGNRALVQHVVRVAKPEGKRVLELFAGAGNFTRALAKVATRVWASDNDKDAGLALSALAKTGLPINGKKQNALSFLPKLADGLSQYDVVVVDPPRAGLGEAATAAACKVASERIVYVSCDPATLARDLAVATRFGFALTDVSVFDLMPMTPEVEVVATLQRRGGGG